MTELFNGDYINTNDLKDKADEVLFEQLELNRKNIIIEILSGILQGIGVALLFIPIYKSFTKEISTLIVFTGLILYIIGTSIKIKR